MERQEPQGEENGDLLTNLSSLHLQNPQNPQTPLAHTPGHPQNPQGLPPNMPNMSAMELQMQLQSRNMMGGHHGGHHHGGHHGHPRPPSRPPMTSLDSHNMFPSLPRSLHEELISQQQAKLRGLVPGGHSPSPLSPMIGGVATVPHSSQVPPVIHATPTNSSNEMLSKLTPSVYSHPTGNLYFFLLFLDYFIIQPGPKLGTYSTNYLL